ncbi:MAG: TolC family protein [Fuerstiella sp.]
MPRRSGPLPDGPIIQSQQAVSRDREERNYQRWQPPVGTTGAFVSHPHPANQPEEKPVYVLPEGNETATPVDRTADSSADTEIKSSSSAAASAENTAPQKTADITMPGWSQLPKDHESTPAETEQKFQHLPNRNWSQLPSTNTTGADNMPRADNSPRVNNAPRGENSTGIDNIRRGNNAAAGSQSKFQHPSSSAAAGTTPPTALMQPGPAAGHTVEQPFSNRPQPTLYAQPPVPGVPMQVPSDRGQGSVVIPNQSSGHGNGRYIPQPDPVYSAPNMPQPPVVVPTLPPQTHAPNGPPIISGAPQGQHTAEPLMQQAPARSDVANEPIYQGHSVVPPGSGGTFPGGHSVFAPAPGTSGFRATVEHDAARWMSPYNLRADQSAGQSATPVVIPDLSPLPPGFTPWWDATVRQGVGLAPASIPVDVSGLLQDALRYSPQVIAIQAEPEVQYRVITQEAARFDWSVFLETTYDDLNDPVGNELTTGNGDDRLMVRKVLAEGGIRRKNLYGGEFRLAQRLGHENQNSRFFIPNNQGSTRLELSYRQPLLDGAGRCYNESEIILARIQANSSEDEVVDALQSHLIEVTKAYWALYRARAEFFQRQKLLSSAQHVLTRLEGRSQVDTIPRQVLRAQAAVARAQTRIQRTLARVRDAEAQLRLLVNSPSMLNGGPIELTPIEPPSTVTESADLRSVLQTALINRPDISEAIRRMRAASVRLGVSKTELLPRLDFLVETYVADLAGNSNVRQALRGQFVDNRPGYTVGLEFEFPLENRAARAKLEQRQWELKRSINVFRATVEKSLTDVEIANREVATAYSEVLSRYQSMSAAENESRYLQDRFEVLPAAEDSAVLLLEDLLDSFERLADEESAFVQAHVDHAVAIVKLKQELGILLRSRHARPAVESADQQWIDHRLESAFDIPSESGDNRTDTAIVETGQPPSGAHAPSPRPAAADPAAADATGAPIPATPTAWSRARGRAGGHSNP